MWNALSSLIFGQQDGKEMISLQGRFEIDDDRVGDGTLTVLRTDESFSYETKVVPNNEADFDALIFSVVSSMFLQRCSSEQQQQRQPGLRWTVDGQFFSFYFTGPNAARDRELAEVTLLNCIFESEYRRPHSEAKREELTQFISNEQQQQPATPTKSAASTTITPNSPPLTAKLTSPQTIASPPPSSSSWSTSTSSSKLSLPKFSVETPLAGKLRCAYAADLFLFDAAKNDYVPLHSDVTVQLRAFEDKSFRRVVTILNSHSAVVWSQLLEDGMHYHYDSTRRAFLWIHVDPPSPVLTLNLIFRTAENGAEFRRAFGECLWESKQHRLVSQVDNSDVDWIVNADADVIDANNDVFDDDDGLSDDDRADFVESTPSKSNKGAMSDGDSNRLLSVGHVRPSRLTLSLCLKRFFSVRKSILQAHNRAFVVRGSRVGVFKQGQEDLEYVSTFTPLKNKAGKTITPTRAMLHQADTSLLLTDESDAKHIFRLDLERGDVVEQWESSNSVNEMMPESKTSASTMSPTLLALNSKSFFALDSRQRGDKCVTSRLFQYNGSSPQLSCGATTAKGQLALATEKGDVRLFSEKRSLLSDPDPDKRKPRATTTLPGFGDPVLAIDVTDDGAWLLATCRTYLMVIPTAIDENTGFETRMGERKPAPRRLQLLPQHVRMMGGLVNFTPARFNTTNDGTGERSIVTSTGQWVVTWNFRKVKQNILDVYQLKQYSDTVVQDQFAPRTDKAIVVALPDDVLLAKKA